MKNLLKDNLHEITLSLLISSMTLNLLLILFTIIVIQMTTDLRDQVIDLHQQVQDERISHNTCKQQLDDIMQQFNN